jgi:hypothetical protein
LEQSRPESGCSTTDEGEKKGERGEGEEGEVIVK